MSKRINLERRAEIGIERRLRMRSVIIRAAFDILGTEHGRIAQIDDLIAKAGIARGTFYNYFGTMEELYGALSAELTHEFNDAVIDYVGRIPTPAKRVSVAVRCYLRKAAEDTRWGWGMVNLSALGPLMGAETFSYARETSQQGIDLREFTCSSAELGRDIQLGCLLAGMISILRDGIGEDYSTALTNSILLALGVQPDAAAALVLVALPLSSSLEAPAAT